MRNIQTKSSKFILCTIKKHCSSNENITCEDTKVAHFYSNRKSLQEIVIYYYPTKQTEE